MKLWIGLLAFGLVNLVIGSAIGRSAAADGQHAWARIRQCWPFDRLLAGHFGEELSNANVRRRMARRVIQLSLLVLACGIVNWWYNT